MPPRHDGFEGGGRVPDPGDSSLVEKVLVAMAGAAAIYYVLVPDIINLATGTLGTP